ncbi:MAG: hypothetical protein RJQ01_09435 [Microcella sp.]|uniref:hypothetical protein n=1 Tax=Microcella sp. TaxID=1913979 RepID=UPI0032FBC216
MRSKAWIRSEAIQRLRADVWRVLSEASRTDDDVALAASALLQMPASDVRTLAQLQFVLSEPVGRLLDDMPRLMRRLTTTTVQETEAAADRVRGPVRWVETFSARAVSGLPHMYVTAPARRAFHTPENELLAFTLDAILDAGRATQWHVSTRQGAGAQVRQRVSDASRWRHARPLADISGLEPSPRRLSRVRTGRASKRYASVVETCDLYLALLKRLDREAIRQAIEDHALVVASNDALLEIECLFALIDGLVEVGWKRPRPRLLRNALLFESRMGDRRLTLHYQSAPQDLTAGSRYRSVQDAHGIPVGQLRPDFVLTTSDSQGVRRIVVEVKGGPKRRISDSARAALSDLLAYRRAFGPALGPQGAPYGLGIAWGEQLEPSDQSEILLCSPDTVGRALALLDI